MGINGAFNGQSRNWWYLALVLASFCLRLLLVKVRLCLGNGLALTKLLSTIF